MEKWFRRNKKYWIFYFKKYSNNNDWNNYLIYYIDACWNFMYEWIPYVVSVKLNLKDYILNLIKIIKIKSYI